eukprot:CAMPEP_0167804486 /NCGR_PEP_ID=MMETSP0111_2-20121227/20514_1 /TAXON_ID=91324 /ORGANISM="Lotharella globosa, Strain CCCM811" /LENGTH=55 /DNA_ID=CAMNT_0007701263 /DNA_START=510 /DNA_END=677 /DNA_ORIENTATION=+
MKGSVGVSGKYSDDSAASTTGGILEATEFARLETAIKRSLIFFVSFVRFWNISLA